MNSIIQHLIAEFHLGILSTITPLQGGSTNVWKVTTTTGEFVIKPVLDQREVALYHQATTYLTRQGVRHAPLVTTPQRTFISSTGYIVQQSCPGRWTPTPTPTQSAALMHTLAHYHRALQPLTAPAFLLTWYDPWHQASSLPYLLDQWSLYEASQQASEGYAQSIASVLGLLANARRDLEHLPRQVVHGDVGPGNVLYAADDSITIIDWTPYYESHLYAVCVALYWHYVYEPAPILASARIYADMLAYAEVWPLTDTERRLFSAVLLKVATRILLVPFFVHRATGHPLPNAECAKRAAITTALVTYARELDTIAASI